jgi:SAM-dependent methyltransferase
MTAERDIAAEQAAYWNGPGAESWLGSLARIERSITGFGEQALAIAAVQPGEDVIDIGCGTGSTTLALGSAVGAGGMVLGLDLSEPLIDVARRKSPPPQVTFMVGDAAANPFEAARTDLLFSRFGVMFFADPVAAFGNLRRALKPTGRLTFVCWRPVTENDWVLVPMKAAAPHLPPAQRPGPEDPGPFAFGDPARVTRILTEAGFTPPAFQPLDRQLWSGDTIEDAVGNMTKFGPLARVFADVSPAQTAKAKEAIAAALQPHLGAGGVHLGGACWLVSARAH